MNYNRTIEGDTKDNTEGNVCYKKKKKYKKYTKKRITNYYMAANGFMRVWGVGCFSHCPAPSKHELGWTTDTSKFGCLIFGELGSTLVM